MTGSLRSGAQQKNRIWPDDLKGEARATIPYKCRAIFLFQLNNIQRSGKWAWMNICYYLSRRLVGHSQGIRAIPLDHAAWHNPLSAGKKIPDHKYATFCYRALAIRSRAPLILVNVAIRLTARQLITLTVQCISNQGRGIGSHQPCKRA